MRRNEGASSDVDLSTDLMTPADGALYWAHRHGCNQTDRDQPHAAQELSAAPRERQLRRTRMLSALTALSRAVDAKDPSRRREHGQ